MADTHAAQIIAAGRDERLKASRHAPSAPEILSMLANGDWLAQLKYDGWRCLMHKTDQGWTFTTATASPAR